MSHWIGTCFRERVQFEFSTFYFDSPNMDNSQNRFFANQTLTVELRGKKNHRIMITVILFQRQCVAPYLDHRRPVCRPSPSVRSSSGCCWWCSRGSQPCGGSAVVWLHCPVSPPPPPTPLLLHCLPEKGRVRAETECRSPFVTDRDKSKVDRNLFVRKPLTPCGHWRDISLFMFKAWSFSSSLQLFTAIFTEVTEVKPVGCNLLMKRWSFAVFSSVDQCFSDFLTFRFFSW